MGVNEWQSDLSVLVSSVEYWLDDHVVIWVIGIIWQGNYYGFVFTTTLSQCVEE